MNADIGAGPMQGRAGYECVTHPSPGQVFQYMTTQSGWKTQAIIITDSGTFLPTKTTAMIVSPLNSLH